MYIYYIYRSTTNTEQEFRFPQLSKLCMPMVEFHVFIEE